MGFDVPHGLDASGTEHRLKEACMAVIDNSVQIDWSPEDVFDYLIDLHNELEWNPDVHALHKSCA